MNIEMVLPRLGETMEEATIIKWLKQKGEKVRRGEPIVVVETDKASVEIPSLVEGLLSEIKAQEGVVVEVGRPIAVMEIES